MSNEVFQKFRGLKFEDQKAITVRTRLLEEVLLHGYHGFEVGGQITSPFENPVRVRHFSTLQEAFDEYSEGLKPLLDYIDYFDPEDLYTVFAIALNACDILADGILAERAEK